MGKERKGWILALALPMSIQWNCPDLSSASLIFHLNTNKNHEKTMFYPTFIFVEYVFQNGEKRELADASVRVRQCVSIDHQ